MAGDNAVVEAFFSLLRKNVLNRCRWRIRNELRLAIVTCIERTYHRRRRQAVLGKLTPKKIRHRPSCVGNRQLNSAQLVATTAWKPYAFSNDGSSTSSTEP